MLTGGEKCLYESRRRLEVYSLAGMGNQRHVRVVQHGLVRGDIISSPGCISDNDPKLVGRAYGPMFQRLCEGLQEFFGPLSILEANSPNILPSSCSFHFFTVRFFPHRPLE